MKDNELRTHNLVLDNKGELHVIVESNKHYTQTVSEDGMSNTKIATKWLRGIETTADWLKKIGFTPLTLHEHNDPKIYFTWFKALRSGYIICIRFHKIDKVYEYYLGGKRWTEVKYVHRIQNLYFYHNDFNELIINDQGTI